MAIVPPKSRTWQLQEAKNRLSEVVRRARDEGPQTITVRGDAAVVVLSAEEYERIRPAPAGSLLELLRREPLWEDGEMELDRDYDDALRDIEW